ncbi:hypothetical protein LX36DRAFT_493014 [Colletotrichum falcatum]|nr:hypothetical protein LX36DRAFT_493014 [Colletotrichum falcatum]
MVHDGCKSTTPANIPRRLAIGGNAVPPLRNWRNSLRQPLSLTPSPPLLPPTLNPQLCSRSVRRCPAFNACWFFIVRRRVISLACNIAQLLSRPGHGHSLPSTTRASSYPWSFETNVLFKDIDLPWDQGTQPSHVESSAYLVRWQSCFWFEPQSHSRALMCSRSFCTPTRRHGPAERLSLVNVSQTQPGAIIVRRGFEPYRRVCVSPIPGSVVFPTHVQIFPGPEFPLACFPPPLSPLPHFGCHMLKSLPASFSGDPLCIWQAPIST